MFKIEVASVDDRESLVAELWWHDHQVAELSDDDNRLRLEIYKPATGRYWEFDYSEFARALLELETRLRSP
jgi:hypothetical protein